jgi:hypothetical protein
MVERSIMFCILLSFTKIGQLRPTRSKPGHARPSQTATLPEIGDTP